MAEHRVTALDQLRELWRHCVWADRCIHDALAGTGELPKEILREYAHVLGAEEVWLARLEHRAARAPVWPQISLAATEFLAVQVREGYDALFSRLDEHSVDEPVTYTNSVGQTFTNPLGEILVHVALHGQYHRGKVNLMLRQAGLEPAPTDYIAFVRGVPAARRKV